MIVNINFLIFLDFKSFRSHTSNVAQQVRCSHFWDLCYFCISHFTVVHIETHESPSEIIRVD